MLFLKLRDGAKEGSTPQPFVPEMKKMLSKNPALKAPLCKAYRIKGKQTIVAETIKNGLTTPWAKPLRLYRLKKKKKHAIYVNVYLFFLNYSKEPKILFTFFPTGLIQSEASCKLSSTSDWLMSA